MKKFFTVLLVVLLVLAAVEAFFMTGSVLQLSLDSELINAWKDSSVLLRILFGIDAFLLFVFGICFFMIPVIGDDLTPADKWKKIANLLPLLLLPFWDSVIAAVKYGWNPALEVWNKASVTWFLANLIAFTFSLLLFLLFKKREKNPVLIYALFFLPLMASVGVFVYQNVFAYHWIDNFFDNASWHFALTLNVAWGLRVYLQQLWKNKL